jgi:plastocyanin
MTTLDSLDSRALRLNNCYGQRFMREGRYVWNALPAGGGAMNGERPFTIEVKPRKSEGKMTQHDVAVRWHGKGFDTQQAALVIEVGDLVLWHCADADAPGYEIAGDQPFFGSAALANECGFTHAFGLPGRYDWVDAHGSGISGSVQVSAADCKTREDLARWQKLAAEPTLVMIQGGKAEPRDVKIMVGQTVYFAIVTGPGITVTDQRLVWHSDADCSDGRKKAA